VENLATVHHHETVAEMHRPVHGMRHHQGGQAVVANDRLAQSNHPIGRLGIERGRVLIEEQKLGAPPPGREQRECLTLAAGKATDRIAEPIFATDSPSAHTLRDLSGNSTVDRRSQTARTTAPCCHRKGVIRT
jgi:hypothetical protein